MRTMILVVQQFWQVSKPVLRVLSDDVHDHIWSFVKTFSACFACVFYSWWRMCVVLCIFDNL